MPAADAAPHTTALNTALQPPAETRACETTTVDPAAAALHPPIVQPDRAGGRSSCCS